MLVFEWCRGKINAFVFEGGVEAAARNTIFKPIQSAIAHHGIDVKTKDYSLLLLGDLGEPWRLGGFSRMNERDSMLVFCLCR